MFAVLLLLGLSSGLPLASNMCATPDVSGEALNEIKEIMEKFSRRVCENPRLRDIVPICKTQEARAQQLSTIPVVIHVLHSDDGTGNVSDARIQEQMAILNDDFAGRPNNGNYQSTNFRFALQQVNRVENNLWFRAMIAQEAVFKEQLSVSPIDTLNIYFGEMNGGVAGMCYFPYMHLPDSFMHGCLVHHESVVGGSQAPYNEGQTLVHEVGHGLGCQHVWQGGCGSIADGDHVEDTPPQETNSRGCPDPIPQSCTPGLFDSIHNHMDYSDDFCRLSFSLGQSDRFDHVVSTFHPGYLHPSVRKAILAEDPKVWDEAEQYAAKYFVHTMPAVGMKALNHHH